MRPEDPFLSLCISVGYPQNPAVLRNVFLQMRRGEILGLVGESGSGKSSLALSILRLVHLKGGRAEGTLYFQGKDLMGVTEDEMRRIRGKDISLVLQSPLSALNPVVRVRRQLNEAWRAHCPNHIRDGENSIARTMASVNLPADDHFLKRYPSQMSVGQAQRVLIAMAVIHDPALLIADEPTSALDVITQSEVLALFRRLNAQKKMAILYISHDLLSVASICSRIAILHDGTIVETGTTAQIFGNPTHPYTRRLIDALPVSSHVQSPRSPMYDNHFGTPHDAARLPIKSF